MHCQANWLLRFATQPRYPSPCLKPGACRASGHGLPTELKVLQSLSAQERENLTPLELRQRCRDYALAAVEQQTASFKRLGVLADWDNAYLTMQPSYEAAQLEALAQLLEQGYLFRAERLVYWSPSSQTTLADAELVYAPEDLTQSQPLDWRTHEPVETRTMTQWFLDLNRMRSQALQVVDDVDWGNEAAKTRFVSMLGDRPDWCVSRQRVWGLPLPAFYHSVTNEVLMTPETVRHFAALVQLHGSDCWWTMPTSELLR